MPKALKTLLDMSRKARMERAREMGFDTERVLYHGTRADIDAFDADMSGLGTHVGSLEQAQRRLEHTADVYRTGFRGGNYGQGANVMPLRARFQRPLDMEDVGTWNDSATVALRLQGKGIDVPDELIDEAQEVRRSFEDAQDWIESAENAEIMGELRQAIQDAGYDSIRYANEVENTFGNVADLTPAARARKNAIGREINAIDEAERARAPAMPDVSSLPEDEIDAALNQWLEAGKVKRYTPDEAARREALLAESMEIERTGRGDPYSYIALDDSQLRSVNAAFDPAKRDSSNLLAGVGAAAVGAGLLAPQEADAAPFGTLARQLGKRTREAWHGSPHVYDQVDLSHMGSGEGAQAYGAGYYAADARQVAEDYAKNVQNSARIGEINAEMRGLVPTMDAGSVPGGYRQFRDDDSGRAAAAAAQRYDELMDERTRLIQDPGALYRLEIPDEDLLDWDAPLSEQPEGVRKIWRESGAGSFTRQDDELLQALGAGDGLDRDLIGKNPEPTGRQIYETLSDRYGPYFKSDQATSRALSEAGIPGIRYLDGVSRSAGEGTRNYVIFDDANVNVVERNGEPIAAMPRGREEPMGAAAGFARPGTMAAAGAGGALASFLDMRNAKAGDSPFKRFLASGQRGVEEAIGFGENLGTFGMNMLAEPIAGYAGLVRGPEAIDAVRNAVMPQSMSPAAMDQMQGLGEGLESLGSGVMSGLDAAGQPLGIQRLSDYARYLPGYWDDRAVPALQQQFGDETGAAIGAGLRALPEAL